ncbi:hypothetical protein, partial [Flavobacterium gilvum]|uniref:Uncharacterized protein n=1 Tax=Flavobacterium gilvum TaxID=1492737 RepID=A0AAC9I5L2_9FLAO
MFNFFFKNQPKKYTKIENHLFGIVTQLLKISTTEIDCDEQERKYYLTNKKQYFSVAIFSKHSVIRMTNNRDSIAEKYDEIFIEDVLKTVKEEQRRRMELPYNPTTNNI